MATVINGGITLPYNLNNAGLLLDINKMIRAKKDISEILKFTNHVILKENFGFSNSEVELADGIWRKLLRRRLNRRNKANA